MPRRRILATAFFSPETLLPDSSMPLTPASLSSRYAPLPIIASDMSDWVACVPVTSVPYA